MEFHPVTAKRWPDLERFFGRHGNPNYCWCMRWRLSSADFRRCKSADRRLALEKMVRKGIAVGILGYIDGEPAGWCSVAPRETYELLQRSRTIQRIDELATWSVVCFFVTPGSRGRHLSIELLRAAVDYAGRHGAEAVEGYPVDPPRDASGKTQPVTYGYMGTVSVFRKAGFRKAASLDRGGCVMRYRLKGAPE